jgi:hypothetical protein
MRIKLNSKPGEEFTIELDSGRTFKIESYGMNSIRLTGRHFLLSGFNESTHCFEDKIGEFTKLEIEPLYDHDQI